MWCDNCFLIFPLRRGAMVWGTVLLVYSMLGVVFFFVYGPYFFFTSPEWQIFGSIGIAIASLTLLTVIAMSNNSLQWTYVSRCFWPFILCGSMIRAIVVTVELRRGKEKIVWECENGGQLWVGSVTDGIKAWGAFPTGVCKLGFPGLLNIFIILFLVDLFFQSYMYFLTWRFEKRLKHLSHYSQMNGPINPGHYHA